MALHHALANGLSACVSWKTQRTTLLLFGGMSRIRDARRGVASWQHRARGVCGGALCACVSVCRNIALVTISTACFRRGRRGGTYGARHRMIKDDAAYRSA